MNHGIYAASTLVLIPNPRDLKFVLKNTQEHRPTVFPGVPTMYVAINNYPDTECKLVDLDDGRTEVAQGQPGELCVRGPQVMKGYWNQPEETAKVLREGWLHTGDVAVMDGARFFSIVDRKKDMIIAGGYNIYPREVEEVLFEHPKVKEAVAVGIPDRYRGETVKAYVALKAGEAASEEDILAWCRERLARYKVPRAIAFRADLPKAMVGKVLRRVLRDEELSQAG